MTRCDMCQSEPIACVYCQRDALHKYLKELTVVADLWFGVIDNTIFDAEKTKRLVANAYKILDETEMA